MIAWFRSRASGKARCYRRGKYLSSLGQAGRVARTPASNSGLDGLASRVSRSRAPATPARPARPAIRADLRLLWPFDRLTEPTHAGVAFTTLLNAMIVALVVLLRQVWRVGVGSLTLRAR
jgi:hypothetical protein